MIALIGESACGKSTLEKKLTEYGYKKLITYTSRSIRDGEVNGRDYHFVDKERFIKLLNDGFFVEHAFYNEWGYGIALEDITEDKVVALTPHGLRQIKRFGNVNMKSFYINLDRRERLIRNLKRGDSIEESIRRNLSDVGMFDGISDEVDFVIDANNKTTDEMAIEILGLLKGVHNE